MSSVPEISVVLPCHNGERFLAQAIESVVQQSMSDWQLIVVDDASTDTSGKIGQGWANREERIEYVRLTENRKLPGALNAGFQQARGKYFTWTSDDNWYRPRAFERMLATLKNDDVDIVSADFQRVTQEDVPIYRTRVGPLQESILRNTVGACFLYHRRVQDKLQGYDEELFLAEDFDFWLRACLRFRIHFLHEDLYVYRVHSGSLSAQRRQDIEAAHARAVERHLNRLAVLDTKRHADALVMLAARHLDRGRFAAGSVRLAEALMASADPRIYLRRSPRLATSLLGRRAYRAVRKVRAALWRWTGV